MHCKHCHSDKPETAFYSSSKSRCKECVKASVRQHRLEKIDYYRQYDRLRASQPHRVAARAEYTATPQGQKAHQRAKVRYSASAHGAAKKREWLQTEHGREMRAAAVAASAARYPDRHKARIAFGNAVRDGRVTPWPVCALPECADKPQGHHPDYSRPLDVVWLCPAHHKQAHALALEAA